MKKPYSNILFLSTLNKYRKYFSRLNKKIRNGSFYKMAAHKRKALLRKVEKLRMKLEMFQSGAVKYAGAGALTLMLGIGAANAQTPGPFVLNNEKNPFPIASSPITFNSGYGTEQISFADLDNDGDLDVVGSNYYDFKYFENTGTASAPVFEEQTGASNPFDGIIMDDGYASQTLADLDNDGDFDLVAGQNGGYLFYFKNIGTVSAPVFEEQTGTLNPLYGFDLGDELVPFAVDIDDDGDFDLMVGEEDYGAVIFLQNTGTASAPAFTHETGTLNPFYSLNPVSSYRAHPAFVDIDNDGDFDAVIGDAYGELTFYRNTGTASSPVFTQVTGTENPLDGFSSGPDAYALPTFVDIDNDGDQDLFVGGYGQVQYFENTGDASNPAFTSELPLSSITEENAALAMVDIDNDGDEDAFIGNKDGLIFYFENTGTASAPVLVQQTGTLNPLDGVDLSYNSAPAFVDIDNDGDQDLFIGSGAGPNAGIFFYKNTGTPSAPVFDEQTGTDNPISSTDPYSVPSLADLDNDGDFDLVVGIADGSLKFYRNTGTSSAPVFAEETGTLSPVDGITVYASAAPVLFDLDNDGDLDLVIGKDNGGAFYYQNTGTASAPVFTEQTGTFNPFDSSVMATNIDKVKPAFWDLDNDSDLDLFLGLEDGNIVLYENNDIVTSIVKPGISYVYSAIEAYPNPTTGSLSINIPTDLAGEAEITLSDIRGNVLFREERSLTSGNLSYENALSESPSGIYVVKIKMDNRVGVAKIVKN